MEMITYNSKNVNDNNNNLYCIILIVYYCIIGIK